MVRRPARRCSTCRTCCSGTACYNAPNSWYLGWIAPLSGADLSGSTLEVGMPKTFILPPQNKARQSIIRVNPTWTITGKEPISIWSEAETVPVWYVAFRPGEKPFDDIRAQVTVHTSSQKQVGGDPRTRIAHATIRALKLQ